MLAIFPICCSHVSVTTPICPWDDCENENCPYTAKSYVDRNGSHCVLPKLWPALLHPHSDNHDKHWLLLCKITSAVVLIQWRFLACFLNVSSCKSISMRLSDEILQSSTSGMQWRHIVWAFSEENRVTIIGNQQILNKFYTRPVLCNF